MPDIRLKDFYAYYKVRKGENLVIQEMTAFFPNGKISVIVGPSGCGKTTLLKCLLGLQEYDGDIFFGDVDIYNVPTYKRSMAYINQDVSLYPHMTIFENIAFPLSQRNLEKDEILRKTRDIAERFGIAHCLNVRGKYLSLGQQQRALLARELVNGAKIVLMDEPVSHLHKELKSEILDFIKKLNQDLKMTIIYVTHSYYETMKIADQIYVMNKGEIVEQGSPKKIALSSNEFIKTMRENEQI